ncbi:MAG TPA: hypothetical protein VHU19_14385 [Pyrinomonadaceae bacterium]|nr:hypothetical protein [Pyrinomonadaceae bacterium]
MRTEKCVKHPEVDSIHCNVETEEPLCVTCVVSARRDDPALAAKIRKYYDLEARLPEGRHSAKICFQVLAGLIPGKGEPEFTEEWWITSAQLAEIISDPMMTPESPDNLFMRAGDEARWYVERVTDPRVVNFARLDFIYF